MINSSMRKLRVLCLITQPHALHIFFTLFCFYSPIAWNNKFFVREWGVKLTIKNTWKGCAPKEMDGGFMSFLVKIKRFFFTPVSHAADCRSRIRTNSFGKIKFFLHDNKIDLILSFFLMCGGKNLDNTKRNFSFCLHLHASHPPTDFLLF